MNPLRSRLLTLLILAVVLLSCRKDRPEPSWEVDVLAPLLLDTVFITDVISDTLITVNPDLSVSFVFEDKLYEARVDSLVQLPDTLISLEFDLQYLPFPINLQPGDTIIAEEFDWPLDIDEYNIQGVKLVEGLIRTGQLVFEVLDESETDLLCVLGIRSAIRNETDTFRLEEKVLNGELFTGSYDISEYRLGLTGENGDTVNMLSYYLALIVHPDEPGQVTLHPQDKFSVDIRFDDITLDYVLGYFGQNTFTLGPDEADVDLFGDLDIQGLSVEQAAVELEIRNYFGLEGNFRVKELTATNTETGMSASLESNMIDSSLFVDRAMDLPPGSGQVVPSIHAYDFSDSNFGELLSLMPDRIAYTMGIETNVYGNSASYDNFFYYDEPIRVYMKASIDQGIRIDDLFVTSTLDWNAGGAGLDNVMDGRLIMVFNNGFPFSLKIELTLLDNEMNVLETMITDGFIAPGLLDEENRVEVPVETRIPVPLTESLKQAVTEARFASYSLFVNSADNAHVMIYSDDLMTLKVIGDFNYLIQQKD